MGATLGGERSNSSLALLITSNVVWFDSHNPNPMPERYSLSILYSFDSMVQPRSQDQWTSTIEYNIGIQPTVTNPGRGLGGREGMPFYNRLRTKEPDGRVG